MPVELPQRHVAALHDVAVRLIDKRKPGTDLKPLARDLLRGFFDVCMLAGLDRVLIELEQAFPPLDFSNLSDRSAIEDHEGLFTALVTRLGAINLDGGGPLNVKPRQLAECVVAALGLTLVEEPDQTITLADDVRTEVVAAIASVIDAELAIPKIRETIITEARTRCDDSLHAAFDKVAAQLDDRGFQLIKQPKISIDAMQKIQRSLSDARTAIIARVVGSAIDRASAVLARADTEVAARIDRPVTLRATVREVAIRRATDSRVAKTPTGLNHSVFESLSQLARIEWRAPERPVLPYAASRTFSVGDLIDHPKFGRGSVVAALAQRIDVEFADGKHTLVHVPARR
ncbi:MAG: hypothetical protein AB7P03_13655 [Kofleriaceae bacterium]